MTNHTIFLKDHRPICENPDRLGFEPVVNSVTYGNTCGDCNALLFTYNKNEFAKDYNRYGVQHIPSEDKSSSVAMAYPWVLVIILSILLVLEVLR